MKTLDNFDELVTYELQLCTSVIPNTKINLEP